MALDELFSEQAGLLIDHPGVGRTGRVAGTCELVAHRNYILIYDAAATWIVLGQASQQPPKSSCRPEVWTGRVQDDGFREFGMEEEPISTDAAVDKVEKAEY